MYGFVDQPLAELPAGAGLLVVSMRQWVMALGNRVCPAGRIAAGFAGSGVLPAVQPFMVMMAVLNCHARQTLRFCAPECPRVSEDEAVLLALVDAVQHREMERLRGTLAMLVAEGAVPPLLDALIRLVAAFEVAGLAHLQRPGFA